jgi:hypothetical protein
VVGVAPRVSSLAHAPASSPSRSNDVSRVRATRRGANICRQDNELLLFCEVRPHFMAWSEGQKREGRAIDVARQPRVDMLDHAKFKWLLHLDGQTCSSR